MSSVIKVKPNQTSNKPARKSVKRRVTSDSEDEDQSPVPTPPAKKRRKSATVDIESGRESPLSSPPPLPDPSTRSSKGKRKQVRSDYEDADEAFIPELDNRSSTVSKKPKLKKFDLKGKGRPKAKPAKDEVITAKNEGINLTSAPSSSQKKQTEAEEDKDIDVTSVNNTIPASGPSQPELPKKKYPTIKKKSKPDQPTTSHPASPAPQVASKPPPDPEPTKESNVPTTILNPSGTGDFDLRDSSTWLSLIGKSSSTAGPKVGIEKRVGTEERKKQLDKARDEARAQRERDFKDAFDLQAQSQKINLFEKRLSLHSTKMHGPSVVGAAFLLRPLLSQNQESPS